MSELALNRFVDQTKRLAETARKVVDLYESRKEELNQEFGFMAWCCSCHILLLSSALENALNRTDLEAMGNIGKELAVCSRSASFFFKDFPQTVEFEQAANFWKRYNEVMFKE